MFKVLAHDMRHGKPINTVELARAESLVVEDNRLLDGNGKLIARFGDDRVALPHERGQTPKYMDRLEIIEVKE